MTARRTLRAAADRRQAAAHPHRRPPADRDRARLAREKGIRQANRALEGRNEDQARAAAQSIESLIARNALALRIAANGALADGAQRHLRSCSAVARRSPRPSLRASSSRAPTATPICAVGDIGDSGTMPLDGAGRDRLPDRSRANAIAVRVGVIDGMATAALKRAELLSAARRSNASVGSLVLLDGQRELPLIGSAPADRPRHCG